MEQCKCGAVDCPVCSPHNFTGGHFTGGYWLCPKCGKEQDRDRDEDSLPVCKCGTTMRLEY